MFREYRASMWYYNAGEGPTNNILANRNQSIILCCNFVGQFLQFQTALGKKKAEPMFSVF